VTDVAVVVTVLSVLTLGVVNVVGVVVLSVNNTYRQVWTPYSHSWYWEKSSL